MNTSRSTTIASVALFGAGCVLVATGLIHLLITPQIYHWFTAFVPRGLSVVGPAFLLDHLIAGVLLLALGLTTSVAALGLRSGDARAWSVVLINTIGVASMPLLLVLLMRSSVYRATAFVTAEVLVTLAAIAMLGAVIWARPRRRAS